MPKKKEKVTKRRENEKQRKNMMQVLKEKRKQLKNKEN